MTHTPVLLHESIDALNLKESSVVVDATLGSGGHSTAILEALDQHKGAHTLIGIDVDPTALASLEGSLSGVRTEVLLFEANFKDIQDVLKKTGVSHADAILADLGWRIEQFAEGGRGFSFQYDEPLLMTYGDPDTYPFTARDLLNTWDEEDIANVLFGYGEERYARRIARAIVEARREKSLETTGQLVDLINSAVPSGYRRGRTHPATKSFQALRIAVNDELTVLSTFIDAALESLASGGRLAIITFHSIEDRVVKESFRALEQEGVAVRIGKKPHKPTERELSVNPRARSAKLRILEKL